MVIIFSESIMVKKIKLEGNYVKFIIDEKGAGFILKSHHIAELVLPIKNVALNLYDLLRKSPGYEIDNVEMVLEGSSTSISGLK